jgi:hypothetical protein
VLLAVSVVALAEEDSIVKDANGDYVVTYRSYGGRMVRVVWVPSTKIDPATKWDVSDSQPDLLAYRYKFKNGRTSKQALNGGRLIASNVVPRSQVVPSGWDGTVVDDWGRSSGIIVGWSFDRGESWSAGLKAGASQSGFGFDSSHLPGIGMIEFWGSAPAGQSFPDEGPDELSPIREKFNNLTGEFVPRNTAIPKIPVGNPYDGAAVLDSLRAHITKDIIELKLIEPTLASELDRILQAAAGAIRLNSIKVARDHLHDAFKLVQKAHPDLDKDDWDDEGDDAMKGKTGSIDRLAARVIAFDIKYVEKRLKD